MNFLSQLNRLLQDSAELWLQVKAPSIHGPSLIYSSIHPSIYPSLNNLIHISNYQSFMQHPFIIPSSIIYHPFSYHSFIYYLHSYIHQSIQWMMNGWPHSSYQFINSSLPHHPSIQHPLSIMFLYPYIFQHPSTIGLSIHHPFIY